MKKRLLLLECFFIIFTLITITKTYGLFETNSQATSNIPIAKWVIKVDGKDLTLAKELNYSDFIITNNNHNDDGYFAPGTVASYTLDIDTSASEVAVSYAITIDASALDKHPNIKFNVMDLEGDSLSNDGLTYEGVIKLEDIAKIRHLKINLEWQDDPNYNDADTSLIGEELPIKLEAKFSQYIAS